MKLSVRSLSMRQFSRVWSRATVLLVILAIGSAGAQSSLGELRRQMTRGELETALVSYDKLAASTSDKKVKEQAMVDAAAIRERLRIGDFYPGDRIALRVLNDTTLTDTLTVKQGRLIEFRSIPPLSLAGVLDSELLPQVKAHIAKYVRDPDVSVTPLVRLQLSGGIAQPGWHQFPTDQTLSDAIMSVGGPTQSSQIQKSDILRGGRVIVDRSATARALRSGKTIGDLGLRDGDELRIAERSVAGNSRTWVILPFLTSLLLTFRLIRRTRS